MAQYWIDFRDLSDLTDFTIAGDYTVELADDTDTEQSLKITSSATSLSNSTAVTYDPADSNDGRVDGLHRPLPH